jgi:hypothetical protein
MRRAQIQLEEKMYDMLRHRAFKEKKSIAGVIREIVKRELTPSGQSHPSSVKDFTFIGIGRSRQGLFKPVSERHDEVLEEVFQK